MTKLWSDSVASGVGSRMKITFLFIIQSVTNESTPISLCSTRLKGERIAHRQEGQDELGTLFTLWTVYTESWSTSFVTRRTVGSQLHLLRLGTPSFNLTRLDSNNPLFEPSPITSVYFILTFIQPEYLVLRRESMLDW